MVVGDDVEQMAGCLGHVAAERSLGACMVERKSQSASAIVALLFLLLLKCWILVQKLNWSNHWLSVHIQQQPGDHDNFW